MKVRIILIGAVLVVLLGLGAWFGWRWYTTPVPPEVPLNGVDGRVVELVERALDEVRQQPRSAKAWGKLSLILVANNFTEQAVECLVRAERFDPDNPRWPSIHGTLVLDNKPQEGITLLRRGLALTAAPKDREAILFHLALALIKEGQLDEAEKLLDGLREIVTDNPSLRFGLGMLANAREDRAAACEHLRTLTENPFAGKKVCSLLAVLTDGNVELRRSYEARAASLPKDRDWPSPFEDDFSSFQVESGKRIETVHELQRAGKRQEALILLRKFAAESPDAEVCSALGFILFQMDQFEDTVKVLRDAIAFDPRIVKTHVILGAALVRIGEKEKQKPGGKTQALELFRQAVAAEDAALALQKTHAPAHLLRGQALQLMGGRTDDCLRALRDAVLFEPDNSFMHLTLGEALAEAGKIPEALQHLENAVRLAEPNDSRPRLALEKWRPKAKRE